MPKRGGHEWDCNGEENGDGEPRRRAVTGGSCGAPGHLSDLVMGQFEVADCPLGLEG